MKKAEDILDLKKTLYGLRYIADSPPGRYGGFHETTIKVAKSALHHIRRLRRSHEAKASSS